MSSIALKSAWKYKIDPTNIFDDNFLKEKDSALKPIDFFLKDQILISNDNINNKNISINNEEIHKKNSIKESDIYDSNIIIIKEQSDEETEFTSFNNQLGKEIQKINSLMLPKIKTKKKNKISFKPIKY
jgi:hypothetical protein